MNTKYAMPVTRALLLGILCFFLGKTQAQTFENTLGDPQVGELAWDGRSTSGNGYAAVSTRSTNVAQWLQLTRIDNNGRFLFNKFYQENQEAKNLSGRALELARQVSGEPVFYMAGARLNNKEAAVWVTKFDGTPLHALHQINSNSSRTTETCTALELVEKGAATIGNSTRLINSSRRNHFFAARFDNTPMLNPLWSFHYFAPENSGLTYYAGKSCTGTIKLPTGEKREVLVLTGYYIRKGSSNHAFVSCIDLQNGAEIWRKGIYSGLSKDEGMDVIQDPKTGNFTVVGYAQQTGLRKQMFVMQITEMGNFVGGAHYAFGQGKVIDLIARDVTLSAKPDHMVIAGYMLDSLSGVPRAFALELPFAVASNPTWAKFYTNSQPSSSATESIERMTEDANTRGYYLVTQKRNGRTNDIHVVGMDLNGETGLGGCPVKVLKIKPKKSGDVITLKMAAAETKWERVPFEEVKTDLKEDPCK